MLWKEVLVSVNFVEKALEALEQADVVDSTDYIVVVNPTSKSTTDPAVHLELIAIIKLAKTKIVLFMLLIIITIRYRRRLQGADSVETHDKIFHSSISHLQIGLQTCRSLIKRQNTC